MNDNQEIKTMLSQILAKLDQAYFNPNLEIGHQIEKINIGAKDKSFTIDFDVKKAWDQVIGIFVYSDTAYASNRNLVFDKPFKINNEELFCEDFNTFFLQNRLEFQHYWQKNADGNGSKVEGSIVDPNNVSEAYDLTIELLLAREIKR